MPAVLVGHTQQLLYLHDEMFARAQSNAAHHDGDDGSALRCDRNARLRTVAPGLDPCIDGDDEADAEDGQPEVEDAPLLGRAFAQAERGNSAEEDGERGTPECGEAG